MPCKLCQRKTEDSAQLCRYHLAARDALKRGYTSWTEAYRSMPWSEYLNRVKALEDTGRWVKEVVALEEGNANLD
jgi:hypothetical protein